MINRKEILTILSVSIILSFAITFLLDFNYFLATLLSLIILISINIFAKKLAGNYFEANVEIKLWEFKRWGYLPQQRFKRNFPAGIFFPIFSKLIFFSLNGFVWMASLVFDVKANVFRAAKRHGMYSFSEISEDHLAYIAAFGVFANLVFAVLAYLIGFSDFAKFSIWFAFYNMIPLSNLDGNKIFFGSKVLWSFLATIVLIGLGYTFLVI